MKLLIIKIKTCFWITFIKILKVKIVQSQIINYLHIFSISFVSEITIIRYTHSQKFRKINNLKVIKDGAVETNEKLLWRYRTCKFSVLLVFRPTGEKTFWELWVMVFKPTDSTFLASSQLTISVHWQCYCTVHVYVVIRVMVLNPHILLS